MSEGGEIFEFDGFVLNVTERTLLRPDGEQLHLSDKAFETLCVLVRNAGRLVKKSELLDQVWADSFVEENNLNKNVLALRRALGEKASGQQFIETVKKHGFRFVPDVRQVSINGSSNGNGMLEAPIPRAGEPMPWYQQKPVAAVAGILVVLGLVVVGGSFLYRSQSAPAKTQTHIAVLPLKPIDAANRSDPYEIGVADALIHRLNSIQGFVARPLSATRKYDALDQDAVAAGREQQADHVIASTYQIADGKFRLTAQLINVANGAVEGTYPVETAAGDIFALQDAVTQKIAKELIARFDRTTMGRVAKRGTDNEEAYRLYLQGKRLTMLRFRDAGEKAVENLEQAIRLDPNFAPAYAQLARVIRNSDPEQEAQRVKELVDKALALDPELADAYVARAEWVLTNEWNFPAVEKDLTKAIELDQNNDAAHWLLGLLHTYRGRFDEGLRELDTARSIDPGAVMYMFHRGRVLYYARRDDEALTQYQQAMDLDDRFVQPYGWSVRIYENRGDYAAAYQSLVKREEKSPRWEQVAALQKAYETGGWMGARRHISDTSDAHFDIARLHALLGEKDAAFQSLDKAMENRSWLLVTINVEPAFASLRSDPRFATLQQRVALERR